MQQQLKVGVNFLKVSGNSELAVDRYWCPLRLAGDIEAQTYNQY
jgi:hypothetical protein